MKVFSNIDKIIEEAESLHNVDPINLKKENLYLARNDKGEILHCARELVNRKYAGKYVSEIVNNEEFSFYEADYSWLPPCSDQDGFFINCEKEKIDFDRCLRHSPCRESKSNKLVYRQKCLLKPGTIIARYGKPYGRYACPVNTPYEQLSLPYRRETMEFHIYKVLKPIKVLCEKGSIAPAFGQPGFGIQFYFSNKNGLNDYLGLLGHEKYLEEIK